MVKGISRRVIVIKTPDPRIFDEAIFLVREDAIKKGITQDEVLREAQSVANDYIKNNLRRRKLPKIPAPAFTLFGAGATALIWLITSFI